MPFIAHKGPVGVWLPAPVYERIRNYGPLKYSEMQKNEAKGLSSDEVNCAEISTAAAAAVETQTGMKPIIEMRGTIRPFPTPISISDAEATNATSRLFPVSSLPPLVNQPRTMSTSSSSSGVSSRSSSSGYASSSCSPDQESASLSDPSVLHNATAWIRFPTKVNPVRKQDLYSVIPSTLNVKSVGSLVEFFVNVPPMDVNNPPEGKDFTVTVIDPVGYITPIFTQVDPTVPNRYSCSFVASQTGHYLGYVQIWNHGLWNAKYSPIVLPVSRNYANISPSLDFIALKDNYPRFLVEHCMPGFHLTGIASDPLREKIYVADRQYNKVRVFSMEGELEHDCGTWKKCGWLSGIAIDHTHKRLVLSDKDDHQVILATLDGKFITSFGRKGNGDGEFDKPMGVAVSPNGNLIAVVDGMNHSIQMFDKHGNFLRKHSIFRADPTISADQDIEYPRSVCFDKSGKFLYVSDYNSNSLIRLNTELTGQERLLSSVLKGLLGLTVDSSGNIIVCDARNNCIRVVEPSGNIQATIKDPEQFKFPYDVTTLNNDKIAVLDGRGIVTIY